MEAGRELNALVAEKVMGWKLPDDPEMYQHWMCEESPGIWVWAGYWADDPPTYWDEFYAQQMVECESIFGRRVWKPSEDISVAWKLIRPTIDEWAAEGWEAEFNLQLWSDGDWTAYFGSRYEYYDETQWLCEATSKTAAVAICLAALAVKAHEESE